MAIALESLASIGVLVANAVFIVVSVATYLRMNQHEQRRQNFIVRALNDTREAGRDLKTVARDLARLMERAERSRLWQRQGGEASPDPADFDQAADAGPEPDMARLRPLPSLNGLTPEAYAEWQRLHQVELDRVLSQRRRLQAEVAALRERASRADPRQKPSGERSPEDAADLQRLRQQLETLEARLQRSLVEKDFIEDHLLVLDARERRQRAASAPSPQ